MYGSLLPSYQVKIKHNLKSGERVLEKYQCAFSNKILVQGLLYTSTEALYFYSNVNDLKVTMFFNWSDESSTRLRIPFESISKIERLKNALIFDNSIGIWLKGNENNKEPCIFLTSFIKRDECFELSVKQWLHFQDTNRSSLTRIES